MTAGAPHVPVLLRPLLRRWRRSRASGSTEPSGRVGYARGLLGGGGGCGDRPSTATRWPSELCRGPGPTPLVTGCGWWRARFPISDTLAGGGRSTAWPLDLGVSSMQLRPRRARLFLHWKDGPLRHADGAGGPLGRGYRQRRTRRGAGRYPLSLRARNARRDASRKASSPSARRGASPRPCSFALGSSRAACRARNRARAIPRRAVSRRSASP